MNNTWNPRYVLYAIAHGRSPEDMSAADKIAWPGGCMAGFMIWVSRMWAEWDRQHPGRKTHFQEDHDSFDAWLLAAVS